MSGAVDVGDAFERVRRQVHSSVVNTESTFDILIITPLDVFLVNIVVASLAFPSLLCQQAAVKISTTKLQNIIYIRGVKHYRILLPRNRSHASSVLRSPLVTVPPCISQLETV